MGALYEDYYHTMQEKSRYVKSILEMDMHDTSLSFVPYLWDRRFELTGVVFNSLKMKNRAFCANENKVCKKGWIWDDKCITDYPVGGSCR